MRMDKPAHMTPLYQCWRIDRPPPNETVGRRVAERNKGLMQQWETMVKQQTKVEEHFLSTSLNSRPNVSHASCSLVKKKSWDILTRKTGPIAGNFDGELNLAVWW